jgi:hypothetical protein
VREARPGVFDPAAGDLPVTIDFRSVFAEVSGAHFGIDNDTALFPGWDGRRLPLLRG